MHLEDIKAIVLSKENVNMQHHFHVGDGKQHLIQWANGLIVLLPIPQQSQPSDPPFPATSIAKDLRIAQALQVDQFKVCAPLLQ